MTTILIPYLIAITLLTLTPGLDTTLIIRTATLEGKSKAFQAALGISLGCIAWGSYRGLRFRCPAHGI